MRQPPLVILMIAALLVAACGQPTAATSETSQTWIDAPLNNHTILLEPYLVVFHSASSQAVQAFEVRLDGELLGEVAPDGQMPSGEGGTLYQSAYPWTPPAPGTYLLEVRPQDAAGNFGPSAVAQVTVVEARQPASQPAESPTPLPPTATPEPTPGVAGFGQPSFSSMQVYWGRTGCGPMELTVEIMAGDPAAYSVVLFYRLASLGSEQRSPWVPLPMAPVGNGYYRATVVPMPDMGDVAAFAKAAIQVQVVGTYQGGSEFGRTPVYSDVLLDYCVP